MTVEQGSIETTTGGEATTQVEATPPNGGEATPNVTPGETTTAQASVTQEVATPPPYQPNFTYRVKNQEKTFPDYLQAVVKDAQMEKQVREMLQKADGIDFVKEERKSYETRADKAEKLIQTQYEPVIQHVQKLSGFVQQGDFDSFFAAAQIDKKQVLQWALAYAQMSPDARIAREEAVRNGLQASQLQSQQVSQQEAYARQVADYRTRELDWHVQRPDVSRVEQAFDARNGQGAFRAEVIRRGQFYAHQGQDITVEQAVGEVVKLVGFMADLPGAGQAQVPLQAGAPLQPQMPQAQTAATQAAVRQSQQQKPVIPVVQGSGTSPAKKVPRSFDDLEKRRQELTGEL